MSYRETWRGVVVEGSLRGARVEVRVSGEPLPIFIIAYLPRSSAQRPLVEFAVGYDALKAHFLRHGLGVRWDGEATGELWREGPGRNRPLRWAG